MQGSELKKIREGLHFTQEELAKVLMIATNTVARWERDERKIPPFLVYALETIKKNEIKPKKD